MYFSVLLFLAISLVFIFPRAITLKDLFQKSSTLEKEIRELKLKNRELEKELKLLRDDPVYLEKVARQKFNKAKPNEIVYRVVRPDESKNERPDRREA